MAYYIRTSVELHIVVDELRIGCSVLPRYNSSNMREQSDLSSVADSSHAVTPSLPPDEIYI